MLKRFFDRTPEVALLLFFLIPLCVIRALPSLQYQLGTLGYDYGFYRYAAIHPNSTANSLLTGIHGGYSHILFIIFHAIHLPPDIGLMASLYISALALGIALFLFLRTHSQAAALSGCLLLACSIIQNEAYSMFLWKTILALPLLLAGLWALQKEKYLVFTGILFCLLFTHRTSLFLLLFTAALYCAIVLLQKKNWRLLGYSSLCVGLAFGFFHRPLLHLWHLVFNPANAGVAEGIFLTGQNVYIVLFPIALLAAYGCKILLKQKQFRVILVFTGICSIWILLHLPFFRRFYVYLDLGLLLLGSVGLSGLWSWHKNALLKGLLVACVGWLLYVNASHAIHRTPLISLTQLQEIASFSSEGPAPFVLATSANDAPWLLGYLHGTRLAAPGLFEDAHDETAWQQFWQDNNTQAFLSSYPRPLYIYDRSFPSPNSVNHCLTHISNNFSKYTCP